MKRHPRHFGRELCEAWDLDPDRVAQIEVVIGPSDYPYANVTLYVDQEMSRKLLDLRPLESAEPVDAPAYTGEAPGSAELLDALVCLHYLGRLEGKRCGECRPCLMAARIDGDAGGPS